MWILLAITLVLLIARYFIEIKLYIEPKNKGYFTNVNNINTIKMPELAPEPQFILLTTILYGTFIGLFFALCNRDNVNLAFGTIYATVLGIIYWIDISRRISLREDSIVLSRVFSKQIEIPLNEIKGIYIYSFGKKFIKGYSFTTKLVISTENKRVKFSISSLNKKAILNMIKNNFGVTDYKMFVASNK